MKEIRLEELLGRDEIKINMKEIAEGLEGKVVMVTGSCRFYRERVMSSIDTF